MLYAKAAAHNSRCTFVEYPTGKHMDTWLAGGDHYWRTILQFLEQNVPENKGSGTFSFRIFGIPTIESPHSPTLPPNLKLKELHTVLQGLCQVLYIKPSY